jgi:hypothetical protein
MAPKSRIIERPLLGNGSVATNLAPLSGQQLNAFNQQRIYNRPLHGNTTIVSKTEPLDKVFPIPSECGMYVSCQKVQFRHSSVGSEQRHSQR